MEVSLRPGLVWRLRSRDLLLPVSVSSWSQVRKSWSQSRSCALKVSVSLKAICQDHRDLKNYNLKRNVLKMAKWCPIPTSFLLNMRSRSWSQIPKVSVSEGVVLVSKGLVSVLVSVLDGQISVLVSVSNFEAETPYWVRYKINLDMYTEITDVWLVLLYHVTWFTIL